MKLKIAIGNRQIMFLAVFVAALAIAGLAGAYNPSGTGGNPAVMGHSVDELDWSKAISNLYVTGNVGIGTTTPATKLDVNGQVTIRGGSPAAGKILTSDASGLASWQTPAGSGGVTTYTFYGSNSCPAGDTELYDGQVASFSSFAAAGDSLCVDNLVVHPSTTSSAGYSWGRSGTEHGAGRNTVDCAVCQASSSVCFSYYGSSSCPAGYTQKYSGFITTFSDMSSSGSTVCASSSSFSDTQNNPQKYVWGGTTFNDLTLPCSVCCK